MTDENELETAALNKEIHRKSDNTKREATPAVTTLGSKVGTKKKKANVQKESTPSVTTLGSKVGTTNKKASVQKEATPAVIDPDEPVSIEETTESQEMDLEETADNEEEQMSSFISSNPQVLIEIKKFQEGEAKHEVKTCTNCIETRPVFHQTDPSRLFKRQKRQPIPIPIWDVNKNGFCARCMAEIKKKTDPY